MICHRTGTPVIEVNVVSEQFEDNSIVISVEWTVENGRFNSLSVVPQALETVNFGPSSRQLMLSYNVSYSVSVLASFCGQNTSHSIELHYGKLL